MDSLPNLVPCPVCTKIVSDDALQCPYCGTNVRRRLRLIREEQERLQREADEAAADLAAQQERARASSLTALVVMGIIIVFGISYCASHPPPPPPMYNEQDQTAIATPGASGFSASGKIKLEYSCKANTKKASSVEFTLYDEGSSTDQTATQTVIWRKILTCSSSGSEVITVKQSEYDVGAVIEGGDTTWSMAITEVPDATPTPSGT